MTILLRNNIIVPLIFLAGCSHPIETSLPSGSRVAMSSYQIAKTTDNPSAAYELALSLVEQRLSAKGYNQADDGKLYLTVTLSNRDSDSSVTVKNDQNEATISAAKKRRLLKFCNDTAVRLSVTMQDISNGDILYNGSATQRRCDMDTEKSIEYLATVATSSLLPN